MSLEMKAETPGLTQKFLTVPVEMFPKQHFTQNTQESNNQNIKT